MRNFKIILSVFLIAICMSGCMKTQSLSDLTIVQGVGIDIEDDKTNVTLQYLNLSKSGGTTDSLSGNITAVADGKSTNISNALSAASKSLSKDIFFGQNKVIVFGSEYAKKSLDKGMDYLLRSVDSRPDVVVAMCDKNAKDVIENKEMGARIPAENIYDLLKIGEKNGLGAVVTVNDLLNLYSCETTDVYMPVLKSDKDKVSCTGIAVFSNEKYEYTLDEYESFGFLFVKDTIDGGTIVVKNDELGSVGLEIIRSSTSRDVEIKNGKIIFNCSIKVNLILDEVEKGITAAVDDNKIKIIQSLVNEKVKDMSIKALNVCFEHKSDPFMVGRYVSKCDKNFYNSVKSDWRNHLKNIEINVNVESQLYKINNNSVRQ